MASEIEIRELEPRHYVGVRRTVKQDGIGPACAEILPRVGQWLGQNGIAPQGMPICVYHSVDRQTWDFDIQPAFFVAEGVAGEDDITAGQTAGGEVLTATHVGPYTKLGETWDALFGRVEELGRTVSQPSWEHYVDDPGKVAPEALRTGIYVPLDPS